jgi:DNA topoisomerase-1
MSAASGLGFTADRTMQSAQKLYEGGLITYLRTDGISISTSPNTGEPFSEDNPGPPPLQEIRNFISSNYDSTFLSKEPRIYKSKVQNSQEAHEAIRPTDISMMPSVSGLSGDEEKLYTLIWNRTVASQMESSRYERKTLVISSTDNKYEFRASSRKNIFKGFEVLTGTDDEKVTLFPEGLEEESELSLILNKYEQKFTLPPNRFSEASLIKKMEEEGIGRPSTYATIVKGLRTKKYAYGAKSIIPSDLGRVLTSYLKKVFEEFFIETEFTARMEEDLDKVASGNKNYEDVLNAFWAELQNYLNRKINDIEISNKDEFKTRQVLDLLNEELGSIIFPKDESGQNRNECPKCSSPISLKSGAWGYFVGCSECKWTKKPFEFNTTWETYQELPKDLGVHPDLGKPIYADLSVNGPCVWTFNEEEKKLFGTPDEDEFILDIGLNRAIELIDTSNAENILFTEINSNLPIVLKNGRFGEYTEFDGFNKATKLKPEDKDPNPKVSYYEPNTIDYQSDSGRRYVLNSLRILGFIHKEDKSVQPVGIKIRKPGKAFKFVKNLKVGEEETEIPNDWYKLDQEEQNFIINELLKLKKGERFVSLEDSKVI